MPKKQVEITITSAVSIGGKIISPGKTITVDDPTARNLLHREKAKLTSEDDGGAAELSAMTVKALVELVEDEELEIDGADKLKKPELIAAIVAARAE